MRDSEPDILIIINPRCHQGIGWKRWLSVRDDVLRLLGYPVRELVIEPGIEFTAALSTPHESGRHNFIISAGGDGTMHYLVNTLMKSAATISKDTSLGSIGLGSSNDFLKPFNRMIKGIPVRIDLSGPSIKHDVGLAVYHNENNECIHQYFVVNASFGVTASANWNFNNPGSILRFLKANSTDLAISYTAITTILQHKNIHCHIKFNDTEMELALSNINIVKIPFVSGSFRYEQNVKVNDGKLGLHICRDMNKMDLLKILSQLNRGKFELGKKTITEIVKEVHLSSKNPVVFECDGETSLASNVSISVVPNAINVLPS